MRRDFLRIAFVAGLLAVTGMAAAPRVVAQEAPAAMIIMDGSGSMWGKIGKATKLQIAKRAVKQLVQSLPDDIELGLMAYGHRTEGDCDDIQVLVQPDFGTGDQITRAINRMKFQGKTPIGASLQMAAEEMGFKDRPVTLVLVTDGTESCKRDPCKVASRLEENGFDLTVHVIGFGLQPKEGRKLTCIAKRTGGRYFAARNAKVLARALRAAVMDDEKEMSNFGQPAAEDAMEGEEGDTGTVSLNETDTPTQKADTPTVASYFRGAPVMLNATLASVGNVGIAAQSPKQPRMATDGSISDCQMICDGDPLCAAWSYAPMDTSLPAQCAVFDYATALDYSDTDPTAGFASGMKVSAVQLVRPYVPTAVVDVVEAEPVAPLHVTVHPVDVPADLPVSWSAAALDNPDQVPVESDGEVIGIWAVDLVPGEYEVMGIAEGYHFEAYMTVAADAVSFDVSGLPDAAEEATDVAMTEEPEVAATEDTEVAATEDGQDEPAEETAEQDPTDKITHKPNQDDTQDAPAQDASETMAEDEGDAPMAELAPVPVAETMALPGAAQANAAGYSCAGPADCGVTDQATGLVFALPGGWSSDTPVMMTSDDPDLMDLRTVTIFGTEAEDGSLPTLVLNPVGWTKANGECQMSGAGPICVWGASTAATDAALALVGPSLAVVEPDQGDEPVAEEDGTDTAATDATTTEDDSQDGMATEEEMGDEAVPPEGDADPGPVTESQPGGIVPEDGSWVLKAADPVITKCPAGIEAGLAPALTAMAGPRDIAWGGAFDAAKTGIGTVLSDISWTAVSPDSWQGQTIPFPIEGQPPFVFGVVSADLALTDAKTVTGKLTLNSFADGGGMVGLLNVGLSQCSITADITLTH